MAASKELCRLRLAFTHEMLLKSRLWRRLADGVSKVHGLSDAVAIPLILIGRLGTLTQTALADAIGVEGPTLVRHLDHLSAMGLIERREDPSDRRAKLLNLTASGKLLLARIEGDLGHLRDEAFAHITAEDFEACLRVFRAIEDHAKNGAETERAAPPRRARAG
ncbi:MarR family transcriptional regulator for hemolysin [Methylovirgula ligni]|uniref:MarR family transcriptional regulator for hemolysin n=1 Tax=Methylovirgula ligni TaxID=569860 RepID=A0A3D9YU61_9HYPH|nr:MarR family transcriptional regulator [Methylovirgula ligni]REF86045.1 MarR family transcriptional regulator for hemolysin [Methylovirgula ligni]